MACIKKINNQISSRLMRLPEVKNQVGLSRTSIYQMIKSGEFPKAYSIGVRAVAWLEADIANWIDSRVIVAGGKGV